MSPMYGKQDSLITRAKEMIHANLDHVLKLEELCGELGMTKFQFIRAFKANTGISPYRFF
ncbi:hypothetical protein HMSSN036_11880 [Paenibacillus macerans]|nr:hypothetical protein HMSSN036_11880 [Paenibacillus macerans]